MRWRREAAPPAAAPAPEWEHIPEGWSYPARGWDAEAMQNNVRQVRESQPLRTAAAELAERALGTWRVLDRNRAEMEGPMARAGRKAHPVVPVEEEAP